MIKNNKQNQRFAAISLFSGSGIGDIGFKASGADFLLMNELLVDRAQLLSINFPNVSIVTGDVWECTDQIIETTLRKIESLGMPLFLVSCTAPCQGMSKSGQGTLLKNIRAGKRPKFDIRNRLILPALKIIKTLHPEFVVLENVCEMRNTIIENDDGQYRLILDIIRGKLGKEYVGGPYDVEMADYGISQRRKRLITVFTRNELAIKYYEKGVELIPETTHSNNPKLDKLPWVSVGEALKGFPPLDAKSFETTNCESMPFHRVSVLDPKKYEWIRHTAINSSAFDNQCINSECGFQGNSVHGAKRNGAGINQAKKDTPLYCQKCGSLLPRPYVKMKDGTLRIMSGYTSAYKRMDPDLPCPTLTRNMSFPCSDHKVHFSENRVLSLAEAFRLHTLNDYDYKWGPICDDKGRGRDFAADTTIRESIGESIPPRFLEMLGNHLVKLSKEDSQFYCGGRQLQLLDLSLV